MQSLHSGTGEPRRDDRRFLWSGNVHTYFPSLAHRATPNTTVMPANISRETRSFVRQNETRIRRLFAPHVTTTWDRWLERGGSCPRSLSASTICCRHLDWHHARHTGISTFQCGYRNHALTIALYSNNTGLSVTILVRYARVPYKH